MNIRDEEQLQQYFERQMSSGEEQNFLINVAARDDMRLAFRSQLELLKAVREDKDASGSPTFVRSKTLGALGLGAALVPSSLKEQEAQAATFSPSILQKIGTAFRHPALSLATGLLAGILGTSLFTPNAAHETHSASGGSVIQAPAHEIAPVPNPVDQTPADNKSYQRHESHKSARADKPASSTTSQTPNNDQVVSTTNPGKIENKTTIRKPDDSGSK